MAAVTSAVIGVGMSGFQIIDGINQRNEAQDAINNFKPQELTNPYKNIQLDTVRADRLTRANNINVASSVDALQRAGSRAVLAGIPKINNQSVFVQNKIEEQLNAERLRRDYAIANGEERIRAIQEKREQDTLAGLGQQLNVANQNIFNGATSAVQSGLALASATRTNNTTQPTERRPFAESIFKHEKIDIVAPESVNNPFSIGSNDLILN